MKRYLNKRSNSPVTHYLNGSDFITVKFKEGTDYTFSYNKAGKNNVEIMKTLAVRGTGLGSYITKNVKDLHDK